MLMSKFRAQSIKIRRFIWQKFGRVWRGWRRCVAAKLCTWHGSCVERVRCEPRRVKSLGTLHPHLQFAFEGSNHLTPANLWTIHQATLMQRSARTAISSIKLSQPDLAFANFLRIYDPCNMSP